MLKQSLAVVIMALAPGFAQAAQTVDPDWPCVQRKVAALGAGQIWGGEALPDPLPDWREDAEAARLGGELAARRLKLEEAESRIAAFAKTAEPARLPLVFLAALERANAERGEIIDGIARYAHKQQALAKQFEETNKALAAAKADKATEPEKIEELEEKILWDRRIYEEREQSLAAVCEVPVLIEQRMFSLAKTLAAAQAGPKAP